MRACALVNAAGPWVADVVGAAGGNIGRRGVRLVKGSHLVVPRLYEGDHALILQNPDRRIVFTEPYERKFTLVGTTDEPWEVAPVKAAISAGETRYLLDTVNRYFTRRIDEADVVWSYAGIRPLYDDKAGSASAVTRDYVLDLDRGVANGDGDGDEVGNGDGAPMLSVFGGKITTYRKLAEHAMKELARFFPAAGPAWTAGAALPGGDMADIGAFLAALVAERPGLPAPLLRRLARLWHRGTNAARRRGEAVRPGRRPGRRADRGRGRLAAHPRMGDDRGGRALPTQQARPARAAGTADRLTRYLAGPVAAPIAA